MSEITRRTTAGSLEYLADRLELALDQGAEQLGAAAFQVVVALRVLAEDQPEAPVAGPDPDNFIVHMDGLGLMVECTHTDCRRNGSGHYTRFGRKITVTEVHDAMDAHDQLEGNRDARPAERPARVDCACGAPAALAVGYRGEHGPQHQCIRCATADPRSPFFHRDLSPHGWWWNAARPAGGQSSAEPATTVLEETS